MTAPFQQLKKIINKKRFRKSNKNTQKEQEAGSSLKEHRDVWESFSTITGTQSSQHTITRTSSSSSSSAASSQQQSFPDFLMF
mmetsp:Transcript_1491/g.2355  ORF Transcript_1491/g.2355 Transcript_1491/m.2355 type:complete len:83 (+) Transcript_1491:50-298(+)